MAIEMRVAAVGFANLVVGSCSALVAVAAAANGRVSRGNIYGCKCMTKMAVAVAMGGN